MDLSKLPKLSRTSTPPNDAGTGATPSPGGSTPSYREDVDSPFTAMDVFLSVGVGLLFVFLGLNYGKYLLGSAVAYAPITGTGIVWSPGHPKAGQEVPPEELSEENRKAYDQRVTDRTMGIVSESSLFLFGVASIAAGLLGIVGHVGAVRLGARRGAMWLGVAVTAAALCYALYATVAMLGHEVTPIMTMLALIVGGMTLFVQAGAAKTLAGSPGGMAADPHYARPTRRVTSSSAAPAGGVTATGRSPAGAPDRLAHHRFAHQVLRQHVLGSPAVAVGTLQGPAGRRLLLDLWEAACRAVGTTAEAAPPTGLEAEMTQVGPYSAVVVTMPPAVAEGEANLIGVVLRSYVRQDGAVIERQPLVLYYTLEVGKVPGAMAAGTGGPPVPPPTVLCEWQGPDHVRFADAVSAELRAFREAMRAKVQARQDAEDQLATQQT